MNLEGRRESTNVEDRRGMSGGAMAGIGLGGGAIILALIVMLLGGDPTAVLQQAGTTTQTEQTNVEFTQEEQELASFAKKILAGTEDVWTAQFAKYGYEYQPPKMVLYTGATSSGCGAASSSVGPFYCSADQTVYLDLSFFTTMKQSLGADGDLAYAYVIAHEVGHHVQYLLGTLNKASWDNFGIIFGVAIVGSCLLFMLARYLNALNSGDNYARTLGINVEHIRIIILIIISIIAAGIVSFTGIIGFVGLVGPHMARILLGSDNKYLIPGSMLTGATLMVVADMLAKAFTATPVHIGIVTALFGGPLFLYLIMRQKKDSW